MKALYRSAPNLPMLLLGILLCLSGCSPSPLLQDSLTGTAVAASFYLPATPSLPAGSTAPTTVLTTPPPTATPLPTYTTTPSRPKTRTPTVTLPPTIAPTPSQTPSIALTITPSLSPTTLLTPDIVRTLIPTISPTIAQTPDPNRFYASDNSFSLIPPTGWQPANVGLEQPALLGPRLENFTLNLLFMQVQSTMPRDFYAATFQDNLAKGYTDVSQISEDFQITLEGKDYFRWEIEQTLQGARVHQVFFFFGSGDWKLVIVYSRPPNQGAEYDAAVDEAIKTVRYSR